MAGLHAEVAHKVWTQGHHHHQAADGKQVYQHRQMHGCFRVSYIIHVHNRSRLGAGCILSNESAFRKR
jgi:hypothetical protein